MLRGRAKALEADVLELATVEPWATPVARLRFRCPERRGPDSLGAVTFVDWERLPSV